MGRRKKMCNNEFSSKYSLIIQELVFIYFHAVPDSKPGRQNTQNSRNKKKVFFKSKTYINNMMFRMFYTRTKFKSHFPMCHCTESSFSIRSCADLFLEFSIRQLILVRQLVSDSHKQKSHIRHFLSCSAASIRSK